MRVQRRVTPTIKFWCPFIHLSGQTHCDSTMLAQEHGTMSPAKAGTLTAQSGVKRTNHEASVSQQQQQLYFLTLNIQISHHQQIARLIEAGGVWTA